jgi:hypothetical protein
LLSCWNRQRGVELVGMLFVIIVHWLKDFSVLLYNTSVHFGRMAELVDALDSKSSGRKAVWVQVPPRPPR